VIAGVIVVRYILLPLLGTALVKGAVRLGLIQPDPLYQFILHLQYTVPPAMNIGNMMMEHSSHFIFAVIMLVGDEKKKAVAGEVHVIFF
jgi:hypothetical protein